MTLKLTPLVQGTGPVVLLQRPVYLVGRHPECDLQLDGPKISRRHCCFALAYDRLIVRDLGSRNGVRVNGREIVETQLFRGDEVAIGPLIYRVERDGAAAARDVPPPAREEPEIDLVPLDDV
jgi:predicted component of type VI protein secretion system